MMSRRNLVTTLALGVFLTAACGTDESPDETADTTPEEESTPAAADDEAGSADPEPDSAAAGGEFCSQVSALYEEIEQLDDIDPTDLVGIGELFQSALDVMQTVDVPDELASAWEEITALYELYIGVLDSVDTSDDEAVAAAMEAAGEELAAASAAAQTATDQIEAHAEQECGVSLGDGAGAGAGASAGADPCELLDATALETVFAAGAPEPELEDMGSGFAMCTWVDGETEVWATVMPTVGMEDFLEAPGADVDNPALGEGAMTYESSIGLGRVSSGGGSVAFVAGDSAVIVAVRGDGVDDHVATAIALAESIQ